MTVSRSTRESYDSPIDDEVDIDAIPPEFDVIDAEPAAPEPPRDPAVIAATRAAPQCVVGLLARSRQ
jgi:hypothetical protein